MTPEENNQNLNEQEIETSALETTETQESTIFSAPSQKEEKKVKEKKPFRMIALLLAIAIVIGAGAFAAVKLIPEKEEQQDSLEFDVYKYDTQKVEWIEIKSEEKTIKFLTTLESMEAEQADQTGYDVNWSIDGLSAHLTDSAEINSSMFFSTTLKAIRTLQGELKEYGLDKPQLTVTVHARNNAFEDFTLSIGNESYDNTGHYAKVSGDDNIYLIDKVYMEEFTKDAVAFASNDTLTAFEQTDATESYFEDGKLSTCDKIVLAGKKFSSALVFEPNDTESTQTYATYLITSPVKRYARDVSPLFSLASDGLKGDGAYVFHPTEDDLIAYGFNEPLASVQIVVGNQIREVKIATPIAKDDKESYYAVIDEKKEAIFKVLKDALTFVESAPEDFYNTFFTMEMLKNISDFNVQGEVGNLNFAVKYDEEADQGKDFTITLGDTKLKQDYFQNFYMYFMSLEAVEYVASDMTGQTPVYTVTMKHHNTDVKDTVMQIYKITDQRYQVNVNGDGLGLISGSAYRKLVKYTEAVSQNTDLK